MSTIDTDTGASHSETGTDKELENKANTPATPVVNAGESEVETLRKQLQKEQMEKNMLRNKLDESEAQKAERERKELEDQQKWKEIAEQEKAARQTLEDELNGERRSAEIREASQKLFSEYSDDVVELAKDTGLSLEDATEEAQAKLKAKLDKIADKIQSATKPSANNPQISNAQPDRQAALENYIQNRRDPKAWQELVSQIPSVKAITEQMRRDS